MSDHNVRQENQTQHTLILVSQVRELTERTGQQTRDREQEIDQQKQKLKQLKARCRVQESEIESKNRELAEMAPHAKELGRQNERQKRVSRVFRLLSIHSRRPESRSG